MAGLKTIAVLATLALVVTTSRTAPSYLLGHSIWKTFFMLCFVQLLAYTTWTVVIYPKLFSPLRSLPMAPDSNFFMGQFRRILKEPSGFPQRDWINTVPNEGLIRYQTAFNAERVLVTSPKALAEVLSQKSYDFIKPKQISEGIGNILGIGVLFAEGDEHKRQRKLLNPAFAFRHVKDLYPVFWAKTKEMVKIVDASLSASDTTSAPAKMDSNHNIEAGSIGSRATLDIIGVAGFSRDFRALADPTNALCRTYQEIFTPSGSARTIAILRLFIPLWIFRLLPIKRNDMIHEASQLIRQTCRDIIREKRESLEKKGEVQGVDVLSVALNSGGFTDEELVNQLMTFAAAGHETTASSFTWAIYLLCKHPEVQSRLRKELIAAGIPSPLSNDATALVADDDINRIPYLTAVCNEVLRFFPPVPFTMRTPARPGLTILGQPIPMGTTVVISPVGINTTTTLWGPDAGTFNPDRWLDSATGQANNTGGASSNYAFLTFLHGPRNCIGQGFARAEFAVLVAGWVRAFVTELPDKDWEPEIGGNLTTKPKGGLFVKVKRVDE